VNGPTATMTYYQRTGANAFAAASVWSYTVNTEPTPPAAPTGLTAAAGNNQVVLNWNVSPGAVSYNVKRAKGSPDTTWATISSVVGTTYTDTSALNGTTYYYAVTAANPSGESASSAYVSATPQAPPRPGTFTLTATPGKRSVSLAWTASSGATSYTVTRADSSTGTYTTLKTGLTTRKYNDRNLSTGNEYRYIVKAVNAGGTTDSNIATATPR
jgi:fibronectin type 3 domain-containing protein